MHVNASKLRAQSPLVQLSIFISSLLPLYFLSYQYRIRYPYGSSTPITNSKSRNACFPSSPDFEKTWLETPLISPYNPAALQRYCNDTITWRPNLGLHLPNSNGGIGNVRSNILDFVFYAIEAGATSLVLPSMMSRDDDNLWNVWAGRQPFETFFDKDWFIEALQLACPQMKIVPETEMEGHIPVTYIARTRNTHLQPDETREQYVLEMENWVEMVRGQKIDEAKVVVSIERTLWEFDVYGLPWNVRRELGQVLRFRDDVREFAAEVVKAVGLEFGLDIDATQAVPERAYLGAHLRTESDAYQVGWIRDGSTDFDTQTDALIDQAVKHNLSTVYVACGSPNHLALFRHKCAKNDPPLNTTSKFELLSAASSAALRKMTWDQQALVDMEVLLRSSYFVGFSLSSFSDQIALTRNQHLVDLGRVTEPYRVLEEEVNSFFADEFSRTTGPDSANERVQRGMWP